MRNRGDAGYIGHSAHHSHHGYERALMRLTIALLGLELDITLGPATDDDEDQGAALNGGTLAATPVDTGATDRWMGFTGGWEGDGE